MASPAWFAGFMAAFGPNRRIENLLSLSDRELQSKGYNRAGLQRTLVTGLSLF